MAQITHHFNDGIFLKVLRFDHRQPVKLHEHPFHELVLVVSGEGRHITRSERHPIAAGDIFLLKPGQPHGYEVAEGFTLYNIIYHPERLQLPLFDLETYAGYRAFFELEPEMRRRFGFRRHFRLGKNQLDELVLLVERMAGELHCTKPGHYFRAVLIFMRILERIAAIYSSSASYRDHAELYRLSEVVAAMERKPDTNFSVTELAELAAMSPATLNRAFRAATGKSPIRYLTDLRIGRAQEMLASHPEDSVAGIASRCGFEDSNYFSRLFRRRTGMTPRGFRQTHRED